MRAIGLVSSPRKGGNTDALVEEFLRGARDAGAEVEKVYLDDLCIRPIAEVGDAPAERVDLREGDDFLPLLRRVLAADVVAFGAPVYWQGVPAQLKCFVDRWSCHYGREWLKAGMRGKGFVVLCPFGAPEPDQGRWVTEPVRVWAEHFQARYLGDVCVTAYAKGAVRQMPEALGRAYELGRRAAEGITGG